MEVKPAVNQIEVNPWYQQVKEVAVNQREDVRVEAWAPFAEGKHDIFKNELIQQIAENIIKRWVK